MPDVVLMDVRMPGMSGTEAADVLRRHHPDVPVVLLSAYTDEGIVKAAEEAHVGGLPGQGVHGGGTALDRRDSGQGEPRKEADRMIFSTCRHSSTRSSAFTYLEVAYLEAGHAGRQWVTEGSDQSSPVRASYTVLVADDAAATRHGLVEMMEETSGPRCAWRPSATRARRCPRPPTTSPTSPCSTS